ncbi:S8 family serine peptidase [Deinococcus sp. KNUC1210]|uniref:S8 family peptidase n=1 Tax=Deinococcus sp. KNUC1210 TaxID=2917691 RepID=UPI001EF025E6|nr:S8 family serine peptidase [Deinococcus sp. KNUC1210]ULH16058.1 S8 family serine peptidase [Deinococcus sp. KNUC1210]
MNKKAILYTSLALLLAACGSTSPTSTATPTNTGAAPTSLSARLGLTRTSTLVLPDLDSLKREAGDTSASDVVVSYLDLSDVQTLTTHLGATLKGVIPELHAALLDLPGTLSGQKVALSMSMGSGRLSARLNGHSGALLPVPAPSQDPAALSAQSVGAANLDTDPLSNKQWWIPQVKADQVRGIATGKGVIVGVVDDDFDRQHEDLKADGKIVAGIDTTDVSTVKLLNPGDPLTSGSHGSGSAGTIGERLGNGVGGAGIAPDAILMPIRIFNPNFTGDFNVAYGIVWAVNHGAQVLNNSWGGGGYSQILKDAVDYALLNNVTVVGSAGNDNSDFQTGLAAFPGTISVGASSGGDLKTDFSTFGPRVDLYAPGDAGLTTEINEALPSPARESSYNLFGGTSMAGPVVSGGAALVIDKAAQLGLTGKTALTPYQIKRLLTDNGDPMQDPRTPGFKRLNLVNSLNFTASSVPADGGYVLVGVTDLVTGGGIDGSDVILHPLSGQNKGQDYLSQTSYGGYGTNSKGKAGYIFGEDIGLTGVAVFAGIEPGDYEVEVAGPGALGYGDTRTVLSNRITVGAGASSATNPVVLQYQHQIDFNEFTAAGRNGAPASATNLNVYPAGYFAKNLLGGTFDNNYNYNGPIPAFPGAPAGTPDQDFYKVTVPAGKTISVSSYASKVGSNAVTKVELVDASGAALPGATSTASSASSQSDYVAKFKATADTTVFLKFSSANGSYGLGSWYGSLFSIQ